MKSKLDEKLLTNHLIMSCHDILPHEHVVIERRDSYKEYLISLKPYIIIPNIIICSESNVIIDGHHRFSALKDLGFLNIPITQIKYSNNKIVTDLNKEPIKKIDIINAALTGDLLPPKSSFHHFLDERNRPQPLILLSPLSKIDWNDSDE